MTHSAFSESYRIPFCKSLSSSNVTHRDSVLGGSDFVFLGLFSTKLISYLSLNRAHVWRLDVDERWEK